MAPSSPGQDSPQPRRRSLLGRLARLVFMLVFLVVVLAVAVPFLVPAEKYKGLIQDQARRALGRELRIEGDMSFTLLPRLALQINQVSLAGDTPGTDLVRLKQLEAVVGFWPLLRGDIQVERFVLVEPVINLTVDKSGKTNWNLKPAAPEPAQEQEPSSAPATSKQGAMKSLQIASFQISGGQVSYTDAQKGKAYKVSDLDASLKMPGLTNEALLAAKGRLQGQPLDVKVTLNNPSTWMKNQATDLTLEGSLAGADVNFKGRIDTPSESPEASGHLKVLVSRLEDVLAVASGQTTAPKASLPVKKIEAHMDVRANAKNAALKNMEIKADDMVIKGDMAVQLSGARPKITGKLTTDHLNLNAFMDGDKKNSSGGEASESVSSSASSAPQGWSREPFNFSGLKAADADVTIVTQGLTVKKIETGPTTLHTMLNNGRLRLSFPDTSVFDGQVAGDMTLDASGRTPAIDTHLNFKQIQVEPLLKAVADSRRLAGTGQGQIALRASGESLYAMTQTLAGEGNMVVRDGAIRGVNLAAMMRNIGSAFMAGKESETTDFAELLLPFTASRGVIDSTLSLMAPVLRLTGQGQINVPPQTVRYRLEPKLVGTLQGQGGQTELAGLTVPVVVSGTFSKLQFTPDLSGAVENVIKDPKGALEQLKGLRDQFKTPRQEKAPEGIAPEGTAPSDSTQPSPAPAPAPDTKTKAVDDLLNNLLGGGKGE